jgi:hypothetical protein
MPQLHFVRLGGAKGGLQALAGQDCAGHLSLQGRQRSLRVQAFNRHGVARWSLAFAVARCLLAGFERTHELDDCRCAVRACERR